MTEPHTYWLPHSVNTDLYKSEVDKSIDVLLTGATALSIYPIRHLVLKLLADKSYFTHIQRIPDAHLTKNTQNIKGLEYAQLLQSARICPTCSSIFNQTLAKFFEIPAAESLLLSDSPSDLALLGFEKDTHYIELDQDHLVNQIESLLKSDDYESICTNAYWLIQEQHTTEVRAQQFAQKINDLFPSTSHIYYLTIDRSQRTMQHFDEFQDELSKHIKVTLDTRSTQGLVAGHYCEKILSNELPPEPINIPSDCDFVFTDAPFAFLNNDWSAIKQPKSILMEDMHRNKPYKTMQNAHKYGVDLLCYRYQMAFNNHPLRNLF